jgi:hypothetical protein
MRGIEPSASNSNEEFSLPRGLTLHTVSFNRFTNFRSAFNWVWR